LGQSRAPSRNGEKRGDTASSRPSSSHSTLNKSPHRGSPRRPRPVPCLTASSHCGRGRHGVEATPTGIVRAWSMSRITCFGIRMPRCMQVRVSLPVSLQIKKPSPAYRHWRGRWEPRRHTSTSSKKPGFGRVNLYHLVWVVRVMDHCSVIPHSQKPPGAGDMTDFTGLWGSTLSIRNLGSSS